MKLWVPVTVLLLGVIATGCNMVALDRDRWSMDVTAYDTVEKIGVGSAASGVHEAEAGSTWLRLYVSLTNQSEERYEITWRTGEDAFVFTDANGVTQPARLGRANLPGHLDSVFDPGETKEGYVVFQVDGKTDVNDGTLTWKARQGNNVTVELEGVQERTE